MLAIQLDHRSTLLDRWQRLLLATLDEDAVRNQPKRGELRRLAADWQGYASVDSVSFRIVRAFRDEVRKETWGMITSSLQAGEGSSAFPLFEGSLWRLVTEQPPHWLGAGQADWRGFLLERIDNVIADLESACGTLDRCTWGLRNTASVRHPLSPALGPLGRFLDMPPLQMDGDAHSPRVIGPNYGASERFAVSPGREGEGYMQLPGGQSGHPLSRFYRDGFEDWAAGRPRPLLPGPAVHTLTLLPVAAAAP
jgi:penicillin amidase